jgi:hypothetical protein
MSNPMCKRVSRLIAVALLAVSLPLWSAEPSNEPVATPEAPTVENSPTTANNPPMDFKPSEEISEDFPISLPSDI